MANFVGAAILLSGRELVASPGGHVRACLDEGPEIECRSGGELATGDQVRVLVRPEDVQLLAGEAERGGNVFAGKVVGVKGLAIDGVYPGDGVPYEIGNPNYLSIWVLGGSAKFLAGIGLDRIEARVRDLTTTLIEMADRRGLAVHTPRAWEERAGIVALELPGPEAAAARLRARGILVSVKDGAPRGSVNFYNTEEEIETLVRAL